jgi:glycosyltransferase involved in cell wall biosynthesis
MGESPNPLLAIKNNVKRLVKLRYEIKRDKSSVVISFIDKINVLTLLATRRLNVKVIISERTHPAYHNIGRIWSRLRRICYPWADMIVGQSAGACAWLANNIGKVSLVVIPNPVYNPDEISDGGKMLQEIPNKSDTTMQTVVAMGRLSPEKGFDMLLRSFARIPKAQPTWSLVIFGEGDERSSLARLARQLGIADRVFFPGLVQNPMQLMGQADLFVLSSRFEGFPNVLLEAMASGLPVISFDCPIGPREIIRDGIDGVLVPPENIDALAEAMNNLMDNATERTRLAARATEITGRFALEKIMAMWEDIIINRAGKH